MSETLEQIVRRVAIARGVLLFDGRSQDLIELVKEVVAELAQGRPPVSAEAIAAGLKFCCGREERLVLEISALRNVVQAAMNDGGKKVFTSWNYNFPDDLRDVPKQRQGSDLRNMLRAMQNGEMTVSRGVELIDMWLAGNYSDDMLPTVREGLGEDEMPWDRIDALTKRRDELERDNVQAKEAIAVLNAGKPLGEIVGLHTARNALERIGELEQQRDELLAIVTGFHTKLATYTSVYPGDKELFRLLSECEAAIAKGKP